jgi:glyoxalase family protein
LTTDIAPDIAIRGIHHLTAIATDAQQTVDFYAGVLDLRLVKQTVNFDAPESYHLYFGDEAARPATLVTFFEWGRVRSGRYGIGGTHHVAFQTRDGESQLRWKRYLTDRGYKVTGPFDRVYFVSIYFEDPDGLILEIATRGPGWAVDEPADALGQELRRPPTELTAGHRDEATIAAATWPEPVPEIDAGMRLDRIHHITAIASDAARTEAFYTDLLGLTLVKRTVNFDNASSPHLYFGVGQGEPGTIITYFAYPPDKMRHAEIGSGLTHHFALEVADEDAQHFWQERLAAHGYQTTQILDRNYFRSIYFRDPDGHDLEIATSGPGFFVDESPETAGTTLKLPPWLEPNRAAIASTLRPIEVPSNGR